MNKYYEDILKKGEIRNLPPSIVFTSIVGNIFMFIFTRKIMSEYSKDNKALDAEIDLLIDVIINGIGVD